MDGKFELRKVSAVLIVLVIILAACQPSPAPPQPLVETVVVTEVAEATPVEVIQVVTPTPELAGPRTLVICMGREPDDLSPLGGGARSQTLKDALFELPYDSNSFGYQATYLEKLPSLADGDAEVTTVTVNEGNIVVDANGSVVMLEANADQPIMLVPTGGGEAVPYQGGKFEMDQLSATFKLLRGLRWSDGAALTTADSIFSFELRREPDFPGSKFIFERTAAYQALDDQTTVWTSLPGFLDESYYIDFFEPVPKHIWGEIPMDELYSSEQYTREPVGTGPYMLEVWNPGESIILQRNPYYFRADQGFPKIERVIFRFTGEGSNVQIADLLSGECDVITSDLTHQTGLLLELQAAGKLKATFTIVTAWEQLLFGIQHVDYDDGYQPGIDRPDFFSDVRTRRAFAMCIDRQQMVDTILFGQSLVMDSYVQPQHPLYNPEVRRYEFDIAAGSALLEEAGWVDHDAEASTPRIAQGNPLVPDGTKLEVDLGSTTAPIRQQVTNMIKENLSQCGIRTNIQLSVPSDWFADGPEGKLWGRHFDLGEFAWATGPLAWCGFWMSNEVPGPAGETWISILDGEERVFQRGWNTDNMSGFANEDFDKACRSAQISLPGNAEHQAAHRETQRIFADQLPAVPLFSRTTVSASRPDMCGFIMDPTASSELWNIEEFDYGEGCEE